MSIFTNWKTWKEEADRWAKHRSDENIEDVDQNFVNKYIDGSDWQYANPWTIAGESARFSMGRSGLPIYITSKARGSIKIIGMVGLCKAPH